MGNAVVRIPDDWLVDASALPVMGAVEQRRFSVIKPAADQPVEAGGAASPSAAAPSAGAPPRLRLHGFVVMGKVEVTS
jgi:hypothetical protein